MPTITRLLLFHSFLLASLVVVGCDSTPVLKYELPDGVPYADLYSLITSGSGRHQSTTVYVREAQNKSSQYRLLFDIQGDVIKPSDHVKIAANVPLFFSFSASTTGGRSCKIYGEFVLQPKHRYFLEGHWRYSEGLIPILTTSLVGCELGIRDSETRQLIPSIKH